MNQWAHIYDFELLIIELASARKKRYIRTAYYYYYYYHVLRCTSFLCNNLKLQSGMDFFNIPKY